LQTLSEVETVPDKVKKEIRQAAKQCRDYAGGLTNKVLLKVFPKRVDDFFEPDDFFESLSC
jgi:hypothetical protein